MEGGVEDSKRFYQLLLSNLHQPTVDGVVELESAWKLQRPKFINLLKHAPKSVTDRKKVEAASSSPGIRFSDGSSTIGSPGGPRQGYVVFQQQFVNEALILSDVFELNEIEALKLVVAGQREAFNQPDLQRGLSAVYLFYKNRWYQAQSLKLLMRNRQGRYWRHEMNATTSVEAHAQLVSLIQDITEQLWKDSLLANILSILQTPNDFIQSELDKLQQPNVKGIGGPRHRRMVCDCIQETYAALGDALYYWCCQTPLDQREFSSVVKAASEISEKSQILHIVFAILQAIDVSILETSDKEEDIAQYAPFAMDGTWLISFNGDIVKEERGKKWKDTGAQAVVQLAWAVSLRMIAQHHLTQGVLEDWTQDEEGVLSLALEWGSLDMSMDKKEEARGPFHWLRSYFLHSPEMLSDEFYPRRLHSLITELIVCYPLKMKEWRSEANEECRHLAELTSSAGVTSTVPPLHFEQFMLMIGQFYGASEVAKLNISDVYFCPSSQEPGVPSRRIPQAQIALFKFLRMSGEMLPSRLYVAYLKMLAGLSSNPLSSRLCFEMLRSFSTYGAALSSVSLDNFFAALDRYLRVLKSVQHSTHSSAASSPFILPDEMKGLQAWFDLVVSMAEQDDSVRLALFEHSRWSCPTNILGLLTCPVPLELKGHALHCLRALAGSAELALALSEGLLVSGVVSVGSDSKLGGVQQELEEVESRLETYPVTTGLVRFLASLCQHKSFLPDGPAMAPYVNFILNSVLVHLMNRSYKTPADLWNLAAAVFRFIYNVVDSYDPTVASVVGQSLGFQVMSSLMNDGPVFRTLSRICVASAEWLDEHKQQDWNDSVHESALYLLKIFYVVLSKQDAFNLSVIDSGVPLLTTPMDILLQMLNPQTGQADYVINFAMFLTHYDRLPEHCLYAIRIIDALNSMVTSQTKIVKYFLSNQATTSRILNAFVGCLSLDDVDGPLDLSDTERETESTSRIRAHTALALLEMVISDAQRNQGISSLSTFLTGYDVRHPSETKLENPGVDGTPRTCLHAALDITESALGHDLQALSFGALVEPAYRLLFWLAASPQTGQPTLRYLRTEYDFIRENIRLLKLSDPKHKTGSPSRAELASNEIVGWVLKICALELASIGNSQPSYITSLSQLLLASESEQFYPSMDSGSALRGRAKETRPMHSRRLFEFLAAQRALAGKVVEESVMVPRLHHFEGVRLSKVVATCTVQTVKGYYSCDVAQLHQLLQHELVALQGTAMVGQLHFVRNEIQNVIDSLSRYNAVQYTTYVLQHGFAGFSQTVRLLFPVCPLDWMEPEQLDQAIIETMIEALQANISVAASEMADLLLTLTTLLRRRLGMEAPLEERQYETSSSGALLDGSFSMGGHKHSFSCAGILSTAFKLLVEAILKPENRRTYVRVSLYGVLMNFFRLWQRPVETSSVEDETDGRLLEPTRRERMAEEHWGILSKYIVDLVEIVAKDAADGSDVTKTVAICCLVSLLEQDAVHGGPGRKAFISRGYTNAIRFPTPFEKWVTILIT